MSFKKHLSFIVTFIALVPSFVYAQYRTKLQDYYYRKVIDNSRFAQRFQAGIGTRIISATATMQYESYTPATGTRITTMSADLKARNSYIAFVGSYFPIAIAGEGNSMFTFDLEVEAGFGTLRYDSLTFGKTKFANPVSITQVGVPIAFSYRAGGDVSLNKHNVSMFAAGAGFFPCYINSPNTTLIFPVKVIPFFKVEAGIFLGIAAKLRAVYYLGRSTYDINSISWNVDKDAQFSKLTTSSVKGNNGIAVSLILYPFSAGWNTYAWR